MDCGLGQLSRRFDIIYGRKELIWDLSRREDWRIRPLRGFATSREANTPSAMRLSRSNQVG